MSIIHKYRKFRKNSPFMLVGHNAEQALAAARTLERWEELENEGIVKLETEFDDSPDASFYDTWPHLSERTREELKQSVFDSVLTI